MAAGAQGEADRQRSGTCHFPGADAAPEKNPGRGPKADYSNAIYIFISPKMMRQIFSRWGRGSFLASSLLVPMNYNALKNALSHPHPTL